MAISAVNSATNAIQQQQITAARQQQSEPPKPSEAEVRNTQRTQQQVRAAEQTQMQERTERPERTETPKPVVNAQGQKTGTIINTTA